MTLEASSRGDDRGRDQRPASHRSNADIDDADEAFVAWEYAPQADRFSASYRCRLQNDTNDGT